MKIFLLGFTSVCLSMSSVVDAILCGYSKPPSWTERRQWVRPTLQARSASSDSALLEDLKKDDRYPLKGDLRCDGCFKFCLRMTSSDFEFLFCMVEDKFVKQD